MRTVAIGCVSYCSLFLPSPNEPQAPSLASVTDESGGVLPGVTVTLNGANVAGAPTNVTGSDGAHRFPTVPPGEYTVTFTLQGFAHRQAGKDSGPARRHRRDQRADEGQRAAGNGHRHRRVSRRERRVDADRDEPESRLGRERAAAALYVLRSDQPGGRRESGDRDQLALAGLRQQHDGQFVSARRHRLHRTVHRRGLAVAEHRCDRRSAGAAARRLSRATATSRAPSSTSSPARAPTISTAMATSIS